MSSHNPAETQKRGCHCPGEFHQPKCHMGIGIVLDSERSPESLDTCCDYHRNGGFPYTNCKCVHGIDLNERCRECFVLAGTPIQRSPERHEFVKPRLYDEAVRDGIYTPAFKAFNCCAFLGCGQPRDAEIHLSDDVVDDRRVPFESVLPQPPPYHCRTIDELLAANDESQNITAADLNVTINTTDDFSPQTEAALCGECGHNEPGNVYGTTEVACVALVDNGHRVCGHKCSTLSALGCHVHDFRPVEAAAVAETCKWTQDDFDGSWDTSCDNKYVIVEGTPSENGMKFCAFCGKVISQ